MIKCSYAVTLGIGKNKAHFLRRVTWLGIDAFGLQRHEILCAAFGGWDAAGAKWFGYPTFWVNCRHLPVEELDAAPDAIGDSLTDLANFVSSQ